MRSGVLSVVVPAKNEAASLPQLVEEIAGRCGPCARRGGTGPPDGCGVRDRDRRRRLDRRDAAGPAALARTYPELRPLRLAGNVGQSAATAAGFRAARGDWVATLDADLQNDPADLAALWDGPARPRRRARAGGSSGRTSGRSGSISRWANRVRNAVLGQSIRDTGCSVRIFPRDVALRLPMFRGVHRFFGPLLLREGCRIVQVPVTHRPRPHGPSHYNFWNRSLRVVVDLFGVAWLMRRPVRYEVAGRSRPGGRPSPVGPRPRADSSACEASSREA